jgi:RHS repeat-associated protein
MKNWTNRQKIGLWLSALAASALPSLSHAASTWYTDPYYTYTVVEISPPPPPLYQEDREDLAVKALGSRVVIRRAHKGSGWYPNYAWVPLSFTYDDLDGSIKEVIRGEMRYKRASSGVFVLGKRKLIRKTDTGFRWQDRDGNWIDYNNAGRIVSYGDRNNVQVTFQYGTYTYQFGSTEQTIERITGVFDHLGNQLLWFEHTGVDLTAIRDATNRRVEYTQNRDALNKATSFVVTDVNRHQWTYPYGGLSGAYMTTRTDPLGRTVGVTGCFGWVTPEGKDQDGIGTTYKCEYDDTRKRHYIRRTTPGGVIIESWYESMEAWADHSDAILIRRDINGKTVLSVTKDGNRRHVKDQRGNVTINEYDQWDNLIKTTHPDGTSVSYVVDPVYSNVLQKTDERGIVTKYEYDSHGNLTRMIEAQGRSEQRISEFTYDDYGNRLTEKRLSDAITADSTTVYTYDDKGNVTSVTDPEQHKAAYTHDVMGNVLTAKDPRQNLWVLTYDNAGRFKSERNPLGHTSRYEYDKVGNLAKVYDPIDNLTQLQYDTRDNLIKGIDPYGKTVAYEYGLDRQLKKLTDQELKTRRQEYDLDGRRTKTIDGNGNAIQHVYGDATNGLDGLVASTLYPTYRQEYKYDNRDRAIETIDVLDDTTRATIRMGYDAVGNNISVTDAEGRETRYDYDALNRQVKVTDQAGGITEYAYDNRDNLIAVKDPNGNITRYEYDRANRKTKEIRPLGQTIAYECDANGNLVRVTDPKGQVTKHRYDAANRPEELTRYSNAATTLPAKTVTFSYNSLGALTGYNDGTTSAVYNYDTPQLRRLGETVNYGPVSLSYSYSYYENGDKKAFTGPDGVAYTYLYDGNSQPTQIQFAAGAITINSYQWQAPSRVTLPGGTVRQHQYDNFLRLKSTAVTDPFQNQAVSHQYDHDLVDNVIARNVGYGLKNYTYDALDRLTKVAKGSTAEEAYTYDGVGNRLTSHNVVGAWNYNANNQLGAFGDVTYTYDDNGNTATKTQGTQTTRFVYGIDDALDEVRDTNGALIAQYYYDPFGRRLWKDVSGIKTYFLYADEGLIGEYDPNGAPQVAYGYLPDSIWGMNPQYMKRGANYYFYQNDQVGTPMQLTATDGAVVWRAHYEAFGKAIIDPGPSITNNLRFPGHYYDEETEHHYNWHRHYDPTTGRYIASDPIGLKGGLDTYLYANGNPVGYVDPDGQIPLPLITGSIGAVTGFVGSIAGQLISNGANWGCINWKNAFIAGGVGAVSGAFAPFFATNLLRAASLGSGSNVVQYGITQYANGDSMSIAGVAWSAGTGFGGGLIGGKINQPNVTWDKSGRWIHRELATLLNQDAQAAVNTGIGTFLRNLGGGTTSNIDSKPSCGCQ